MNEVVFICHAAEDWAVALGLAARLELDGYPSWTYEVSSVGGTPHPRESEDAIKAAALIVVIVSDRAFASRAVADEIGVAEAAKKPFFPNVIGMTYDEFSARNPEWHTKFGEFPGVEGPDTADVAKRVGRVLAKLGVARGDPRDEQQREILAKRDTLQERERQAELERQARQREEERRRQAEAGWMEQWRWLPGRAVASISIFTVLTAGGLLGRLLYGEWHRPPRVVAVMPVDVAPPNLDVDKVAVMKRTTRDALMTALQESGLEAASDTQIDEAVKNGKRIADIAQDVGASDVVYPSLEKKGERVRGMLRVDHGKVLNGSPIDVTEEEAQLAKLQDALARQLLGRLRIPNEKIEVALRSDSFLVAQFRSGVKSYGDSMNLGVGPAPNPQTSWHLRLDAGVAYAQSPATVSAGREDEEHAIKDALLRYKDALERGDIDGVVAQFVSIDARQRESIAAFRRYVQDVHVTFTVERIEVAGASATAWFHREDEFYDLASKTQVAIDAKVEAGLVRGDVGWKIKYMRKLS